MLAPEKRAEIEALIRRGRQVAHYNVDANDGRFCDVIEELLKLIDDPVAQRTEQPISNRHDEGSSPSGVTSENIDLTQFEIVRCPKSFCWCGCRVLLLYNGKPPNHPESRAYYMCPRCNRIAKLGKDGGDIRPRDLSVEDLREGEIEAGDEELYEIIDAQKYGAEDD